MNKIKYAEPKVEIIAFESEDIIVASNNIDLEGDDLTNYTLNLGTSVYD